MNFDTNLFFFFNNLAGQSKAVDFIIIFFAHYLAFILIGIMVAYILFHNHPFKEKVATGISALLAGWIARYGIGTPIRFLWHRPRPFLSHHVHQLLSENSYSFPSGHSTFFFAFSTIVYFHHKKLGIFFYAATVCMTIARIMAGVHYPSDILAGAVIGITCGWLTCKYISPRLGIRVIRKEMVRDRKKIW
jgi:undecaprenyl-diphosphatase